MNQKFFKRAEAVAKWLGWKVTSIDFVGGSVTFRTVGPHREWHKLTVNQVYFESLETAMNRNI